MNHQERLKLSKGLAGAMKQAGIGKNYLHQQLFRYLSGNNPVWYDDNAQSYVENAYSFNADVYAVVIISYALLVPFLQWCIRLQTMDKPESIRG